MFPTTFRSIERHSGTHPHAVCLDPRLQGSSAASTVWCQTVPNTLEFIIRLILGYVLGHSKSRNLLLVPNLSRPPHSAIPHQGHGHSLRRCALQGAFSHKGATWLWAGSQSTTSQWEDKGGLGCCFATDLISTSLGLNSRESNLIWGWKVLRNRRLVRRSYGSIFKAFFPSSHGERG